MATGTGLAGVETAVETVVLPAVESHGLTLVDLEVRGNGRRAIVRVFVDKPGGVTVSDCQQLSHEVGDLIDVRVLSTPNATASTASCGRIGSSGGPSGDLCASGCASWSTGAGMSRAGSPRSTRTS